VIPGKAKKGIPGGGHKNFKILPFSNARFPKAVAHTATISSLFGTCDSRESKKTSWVTIPFWKIAARVAVSVS
jgi:hypothetical protein